MTLERGAKRKILGVKAERGYPKNPLRFAVTAAVIMQTYLSCQNVENQRF